MKYFLFILVVFFSSIVFGQSGFNPPKTTIAQPLQVENIGLDTVIVLDSVRVYFDQSQQILDTSNRAILLLVLDSLSENNKSQRDSFNALINEVKTIDDSLVLKSILDSLSDQNSILKDYFAKQENDCIGSNETYYINGTNTITLNASEVCSYTVTVLEEKLQFSENGVSSPFNLPVGYTGSNSFKGGSKFLVNQVSFTGTTGNSKAIIKVIK
jgi:hypothetical protein